MTRHVTFYLQYFGNEPNLNKLEGVALNTFLSSGDQDVSVTPPPALYKGVAVSRATSHT